jgi:hypothetical protein
MILAGWRKGPVELNRVSPTVLLWSFYRMEARDAIGEWVGDAILDAVQQCADRRMVMAKRSERDLLSPDVREQDTRRHRRPKAD